MFIVYVMNKDQNIYNKRSNESIQVSQLVKDKVRYRRAFQNYQGIKDALSWADFVPLFCSKSNSNIAAIE